jgi:hypothetical protein
MTVTGNATGVGDRAMVGAAAGGTGVAVAGAVVAVGGTAVALGGAAVGSIAGTVALGTAVGFVEAVGGAAGGAQLTTRLSRTSKTTTVGPMTMRTSHLLG